MTEAETEREREREREAEIEHTGTDAGRGMDREGMTAGHPTCPPSCDPHPSSLPPLTPCPAALPHGPPGCTRLELGLQSIYEDVARDTNRGHTIESAKGCFQLAKDAGFKVGDGAPCLLKEGVS